MGRQGEQGEQGEQERPDLVDVDAGSFRAVVGVEGIVLVLCWGPSCGVCRGFDPVYRKLAASHPGHTFARMDIQTHADLGEFFEIEHTPTLMLYRGGLLLFKKAGVFTEAELDGIIAQAESLDMARVRADLDPEAS